MSSPRDLVELYTTLGRRVLAQTSTDGALGAVTAVAVQAVPGVAYASITRLRSTGFQTRGATHPDAAANDRTQVSARLVFDDDDLRASLNLYALEPDAFGETAQAIALVMATHGALAVAGVVARENVANLERALAHSRSIGMAMGILMSSMLLTSDEAFTLLRIASQDRNQKLHLIAADVVSTGTLEISGW